jgi:hypothetical protein
MAKRKATGPTRQELADNAPTLVVEACYGRSPPPANANADATRFARQRLTRRCFVTSLGIADSLEWARESAATLPEQDVAGRAVLLQCEAHNDEVLRFGATAEGLTQALPAKIGGGMWGENVLVSAGTTTCGGKPAAATLCVGDVLERTGGRRKKRAAGAGVGGHVRLQIASPRRPCSNVDAQFGRAYGGNGVRAMCARTGSAGFFWRVLEEGELGDGCAPCLAALASSRLSASPRAPAACSDFLGVIERPNPQWSLSRVSELLYGIEGAADAAAYRIPGRGTAVTKGTGGGAAAVRAAWRGSEAELRELAALPELASLEWKNEFASLLAAWDGAEGDAPPAQAQGSSCAIC